MTTENVLQQLKESTSREISALADAVSGVLAIMSENTQRLDALLAKYQSSATEIDAPGATGATGSDVLEHTDPPVTP